MTTIWTVIRSAEFTATAYRVRLLPAPIEPSLRMRLLSAERGASMARGNARGRPSTISARALPLMSAVVGSDDRDRLVGGVRLHARSASVPLPGERRLREPELTQEFEQSLAADIGEVCGCWVSAELRETGFSDILLLAALASLPLLGIRRAVAFVDGSLGSDYERMGLHVDRTRPLTALGGGRAAHVARWHVGEPEFAGSPWREVLEAMSGLLRDSNAFAVERRTLSSEASEPVSLHRG